MLRSTEIKTSVSLVMLLGGFFLNGFAGENHEFKSSAKNPVNPRGLTWNDVVKNATSPEDICRMVEYGVKYRTEREDKWTTGRETWARGYGDCEDISACVVDMCKEAGFKAFVTVFYSAEKRDSAHAVVLGKWDGKYWISSNGSFEFANTQDEIRRKGARILRTSVASLSYISMDQLRQLKSKQNEFVSNPSGSHVLLRNTQESLINVGAEGNEERKIGLRKYDSYLQMAYVDATTMHISN